MNISISRHAKIATTTLRRHLWRYLAIVIVLQLAVLGVAMPLLASLFDVVLATVDAGSLNLDSLGSVLTSPLTVLLLLVFTVASGAFVFAELALIAVCAHRHLDGLPVTPRAVAADLARMARKLLGWSGLLFAAYALFLLPLASIGVTSAMTRHVAVPAFISGELTKTTGGTVLWTAITLLLTYAALRLLLTLSVFVDSDESLSAAMRASLRATGWLPWRPALALLAAATGVVVGLAAVSAFAVLVTALGGVFSDSLVWAGSSLALVDLSRAVLLGLAATWITLYLVAWRRDLAHEPPPDPNRLPQRSRRLVAAGVGVLGIVTLASQSLATTADLRSVRDPERTVVVAHRGYTAEAVENTIPALEAAADAGADVVEMDVLETQDQQLVVMHDGNLNRLAGRDIDVSDANADEIVGLALTVDGHTAPLPSFDDYARRAKELDVRLLVELKPHGQEAPGFAQRVVDDFAALDVPDDWLVQSLDRDLIEEVGDLRPDLEVGYVVPFNLGRLPSTRADFVVVEEWSYSDRLGREGGDADKPVLIWTINDVGLIRDYVRRGVDGIITDEVGTAVADRQISAVVDSPVGLLLDGILRAFGPQR